MTGAVGRNVGGLVGCQELVKKDAVGLQVSTVQVEGDKVIRIFIIRR